MEKRKTCTAGIWLGSHFHLPGDPYLICEPKVRRCSSCGRVAVSPVAWKSAGRVAPLAVISAIFGLNRVPKPPKSAYQPSASARSPGRTASARIPAGRNGKLTWRKGSDRRNAGPAPAIWPQLPQPRSAEGRDGAWPPAHRGVMPQSWHAGGSLPHAPILGGRQPEGVLLPKLMEPFPVEWRQQAREWVAQARRRRG